MEQLEQFQHEEQQQQPVVPAPRDFQVAGPAPPQEGHPQYVVRHKPLNDNSYMLTVTAGFNPYKNLVLTSLNIPPFMNDYRQYDGFVITGTLLFSGFRLNMDNAYTTDRRIVLSVGEIAAPSLKIAI